MSKETYVNQKRGISIKTNFFSQKEISFHQKRYLSLRKGPISIKRDIHQSKETYINQKRHTSIKRSLYQKRLMSIKREQYKLKETNINQKRQISIK